MFTQYANSSYTLWSCAAEWPYCMDPGSRDPLRELHFRTCFFLFKPTAVCVPHRKVTKYKKVHNILGSHVAPSRYMAKFNCLPLLSLRAWCWSNNLVHRHLQCRSVLSLVFMEVSRAFNASLFEATRFIIALKTSGWSVLQEATRVCCSIINGNAVVPFLVWCRDSYGIQCGTKLNPITAANCLQYSTHHAWILLRLPSLMLLHLYEHAVFKFYSKRSSGDTSPSN